MAAYKRELTGWREISELCKTEKDREEAASKVFEELKGKWGWKAECVGNAEKFCNEAWPLFADEDEDQRDIGPVAEVARSCASKSLTARDLLGQVYEEWRENLGPASTGKSDETVPAARKAIKSWQDTRNYLRGLARWLARKHHRREGVQGTVEMLNNEIVTSVEGVATPREIDPLGLLREYIGEHKLTGREEYLLGHKCAGTPNEVLASQLNVTQGQVIDIVYRLRKGLKSVLDRLGGEEQGRRLGQ